MALTVRLIDPLLERPCPSLTVKGRVFVPGVVALLTVALKVNVLPLPENAWLADPPIEERSAVTANPVLVGFVPGVTLTVSKVESPAKSDAGFAVPVPVGGVGTTTVRDMFVFPVRDCASVIVTGRVFAPPDVLAATVA